MKRNRLIAIYRNMVLLVALVVSSLTINVNAQSQLPIIDLGELTFGEEYSAPKGSNTKGFFVAPQTGEVSMSFKQNAIQCLYSDPDCTQQIIGTFNNHVGSFAGYTYQVEKDKTYYISINNVIYSTPYLFTLYMDGVATEPFHYTQTTPNTNGETIYNLTRYNEMYLWYSQAVDLKSEVEITYTSNGGNQVTLDLTANGYTYTVVSYLYIRLGDLLLPLLEENGANGISPLAPFTIKVRTKSTTGQYAEEADADGWMEFSYRCGYIPTLIESTNIPSQFLSYWPKGTESGIMSVTYSKNLDESSIPMVNLIMGNPEGNLGEELYRESFPATIKGNTVYADFTGVRRTYDDMLNGNETFDNMTVEIKGIYDIEGQEVASNYPGNIAKYTANIPFKNLKKTLVSSDWIPAAGSNLANVDEMDVWILGLESISFDGFTVEYTNGTTTNTVDVPMESVKVSDMAPDGSYADYIFAVPAAAKTADKVVIYPTNLVSLDGYNYEVYLSATFNAFTFITVDPTQGSDITNLNGANISAIFNYQDQYPDMFITFELVEKDKDGDTVLIEETPMTRSGDVFSVKVDNNTEMYINYTYEGVFTAWSSESKYLDGAKPFGTVSVIWYGASPYYMNSAIQLLGITPEVGTDLNDIDGVFTITFDGPVRIETEYAFITPFMTEPVDFTSITPIGDDIVINPEDELEYSNLWELVMPTRYIDAAYPDIKLTFQAVDEEGRVLKGNAGRGAESNYEFTYYNSTKACLVPAAADGIIRVYNLNGQLVLETTDANAVSSLQRGIYIVNGKKLKI